MFYSYRTLISVSELAPLLPSNACVIFDARFSLADPEAGRRTYLAGHLPGAHYADLNRDLSSSHRPGSTGRHPLPEIPAIAQWLGDHGVHDGVQVVVYDDAGGVMAARLWWLLRFLGHNEVAVLDGGLPSWLSAGQALTKESSPCSPAQFHPAPDARRLVDAAQVLALLSEGACSLLDARAPARYRGEDEPIDPVAGHIPGAVSLPTSALLDHSGCFRAPGELRALFAAAWVKSPGVDSIAYCGSGVTACHLVLAAAHAGLPEPRLYAGSWSEWIIDPVRPIARGA